MISNPYEYYSQKAGAQIFEHSFQQQLNWWYVNAKTSGINASLMGAILNQLLAIQSYHSKVIVIRIDLRLASGVDECEREAYTEGNKLVTIFNRRFHKWLRRQYGFKRIGFFWCREHEKAKSQHYHYALMLDGSKVGYPKRINEKAISIWGNLSGSCYIPKTPFYTIQRDDDESRQSAIWRLSYLAKKRGKGYKKAQTKNYGASRIKPKPNNA